jgi:UDP-N-acetylmuramate: L-alanyl-gamma-D-glutamyl-meso-diaminopimelate ligase
VIAGSYGKSSTTALAAWILSVSGKDPGYFIGAVPIDFETNAHLGAGNYFILEGDEYPSANWDSTSKFLYYDARTVILTSGEYDHFNEFPSEFAYLEPYRRLLRELPADGLLVACLDGAHVPELIEEARCRVVTYSGRSDSSADYRAGQPEYAGSLARFDLLRGPQSIARIETPLFGEHNYENIVGAAAALLELKAVSPQQIADSIRRFGGLRRRLELKSRKSTVSIYEDLSSSRPKAMAALAALRERYPHSRIHAVFQPHTFSFRSRKALDWYPEMFVDADSVLIFSPPDLRGLPSSEARAHEEIVRAIVEGNHAEVNTVVDTEDTIARLRARLAPGDVVLLMTSGGMGGAIPEIIRMVETEFVSE